MFALMFMIQSVLLAIMQSNLSLINSDCFFFKLPVIGDLRNPSLKPRHWVLIDEVLQHKFDPEVPLTLTLLQELQAFNYAEAIQEISGQASSEASLEAILKKVATLKKLFLE